VIKNKAKTYGLSFISDSDLVAHTLETVKQFRTGMTLHEFNKNIVDPIKLTFDTHVYRRTVEQVIDAEVLRQLNKTNENLIGYFHQNIFRFVGNGWEVPQTGEDGWDVVNYEKNIFAELKSKHNTMNSSAANFVHSHMRGLVEGNSRATCYLVEVVAKASQDVPWRIGQSPLREDRQNRLRRISIDRFYEIVTGDENAFRDLCATLGRVIDDAIRELPAETAPNTVLGELKSRDADVFKTLFLLSFGSYRGFDDFAIQG